LSDLRKISGKSLPEIATNFKSIAELAIGTEMPVDLFAVVYEVGEIQKFNCKDGLTRPKMNVRLVDDTKKIITLGLWSEHSEKMKGTEGTTVLIRNVAVREYNGKRVLTSTANSIIKLQPKGETAAKLSEWWTTNGIMEEFEEIIVQAANTAPTQISTPSIGSTSMSATFHGEASTSTPRTFEDEMIIEDLLHDDSD
jgi:hypothetical protein